MNLKKDQQYLKENIQNLIQDQVHIQDQKDALDQEEDVLLKNVLRKTENSFQSFANALVR